MDLGRITDITRPSAYVKIRIYLPDHYLQILYGDKPIKIIWVFSFARPDESDPILMKLNLFFNFKIQQNFIAILYHSWSCLSGEMIPMTDF